MGTKQMSLHLCYCYSETWVRRMRPGILLTQFDRFSPPLSTHLSMVPHNVGNLGAEPSPPPPRRCQPHTNSGTSSSKTTPSVSVTGRLHDEYVCVEGGELVVEAPYQRLRLMLESYAGTALGGSWEICVAQGGRDNALDYPSGVFVVVA